MFLHVFSYPCFFRSIKNTHRAVCVWLALFIGLFGLTPSLYAQGSEQTKIDPGHQIEADIQLALERLDQHAEEIQYPPQIDLAGAPFKPVEIQSIPSDWVAAGLDINQAKNIDGKLVQTLKDGSKVTFTIVPELQKDLQDMLQRYNVPHGSVVLIEPHTGRVLALVSQTRKDPYLPDIARKSVAPSASVFKVITAAALIEQKKINPSKTVCYHGGLRHLTETNIKGNPKLDRRCDRDLGDALAHSVNAIIAKLAYNHLTKQDLEDWAERFGYNTSIPFELPVESSLADFPDDPIERARSAAGFWHTYLSPLHAAMIGAALANHGIMMKPTLIESFQDPNGNLLYSFKPSVFKKAMSKATADTLAELMIKTTRSGTARKYFRFRNDFPSSRLTVSGKTGTLSRKTPSYLGYTWFAGFGEDDKTKRRVAVSGLVCNTPIWHILGPYAASEGVRLFFAHENSQ